ncbi:MAG: ABC transporter ATP-binding protein [Desulfobacterales bacterium]
MTNPIIRVENLRKCYGDLEAVGGISLHIAPGEFFGLLGPNGAGKTTTIKMLAGLIAPTSGNIVIDGQNITSHPNSVKAKIGLVPQDFAFYPTLNAEDNLAFFGRIYEIRGRRLKNRIHEVLDIAGLTDAAKQAVGNFSNGMKRRLNIAIGLLHEPRILILDEPTVGVDVQSRSAIFHSLIELNANGVTMIYTTHYMEEAQSLCRRIAILDKGRIIQLDAFSEMVRKFRDPVVKIEFADPVGELLYERIKSIGSIASLEQAGRSLLIRSAFPAQTVRNILSIPEIRDVDIRSLDISKPNLEDIFLTLTGRSLRDNEWEQF